MTPHFAIPYTRVFESYQMSRDLSLVHQISIGFLSSPMGFKLAADSDSACACDRSAVLRASATALTRAASFAFLLSESMSNRFKEAMSSLDARAARTDTPYGGNGAGELGTGEQSGRHACIF